MTETSSPARPSSTQGWTLRRDGWGRLILKWDDGREVHSVHPARCFPLTDPDRWISIFDSDGQEVVSIDSIAALSEETRALLLAELSEREFMPVVKRIVSVSSEHLPCDWVVETSRGPTTFVLDSEDHLRKLEGNRVIITDSHGVRYEIPDRQALDAGSQRLLRKFL